MIVYPRHTGMDGVDDTWQTENDYVVRSSTNFIRSHLNDSTMTHTRATSQIVSWVILHMYMYYSRTKHTYIFFLVSSIFAALDFFLLQWIQSNQPWLHAPTPGPHRYLQQETIGIDKPMHIKRLDSFETHNLQHFTTHRSAPKHHFQPKDQQVNTLIHAQILSLTYTNP